jgi:Ca-activated chloride channel family protein
VIVLDAPWLLLLLPLPLLVHRLLRSHRERRDAVYAPFVEELAALTGRSPEAGAATARRTAGQATAFVVAWVLVVVALARPQHVGAPIERTVPTRDLLLAVDLSGSMDTEDFTDEHGDTVDRLTAVKQVLDAFLARRAGDRVGLILFGSAPFVQVPFTDDLESCRTLLDEAEVRMAGPRTVVGDAIGLAITVFESSDLDERVLILLTDGNDTGSRVPPDRAAAIAAERGIVIHTVAVGDPRAAGEEQLDLEALRAVAGVTGGESARAEDRAEFEAVYERLDEIAVRDVETISHRPRRDLYAWPLAGMFLVAFGFHAAMAGPRWRRMRGAVRRAL